MEVTLNKLGYNSQLDKYLQETEFEVGRIVAAHKDRYTLSNGKQDYDAELIGNLRFTAESKRDLPCVGDWVAFSEYDENKALIHLVFPRRSILERKAVGRSGESQVIGANIDVGLIVQSVNRDFSINRIERYMALCNVSQITPVVILSKIDLIDAQDLDALLTQLKERIRDVKVIALSNKSQHGMNAIKAELSGGKTYCLLGSSGVGKSTLINNLLGEQVMTTAEISARIDRGKHVTTHRELIVTPYGILIDNPGMREVGMTSATEGLDRTFEVIKSLSGQCKFKDCTHTNEVGCAVRLAMEHGDLSIDSYQNFQKLEKERHFFESNEAERKKKDKNFGKMVKQVKKQRKRDKF